jgi:predicted DCC family thiol-disulfide oxidoreductase YuxK
MQTGTVAQPLPVLFDGDCGICTASARVLGRLDRRGRLDLVPFHEARRRGYATELSDEEFEAAFHVVVEGRTVSGAAALPFLLDRIGGGRVPARLLRSSPFLRRIADRA